VPRLGDIELQRLTPSNLSAFYRTLLTNARRDGQGLAPKTVRNIHAMLHRALKDAVRLGYLVRNVADAVTPPRGASPEMQVWTPQQLRAFLAHARHDRLYALWLRLGHATIAITLDVYSHVIPGMDAQAANAVASLILDGSSPSEGPGPKPGPSTDK
jgi:integrase